MPPAVNVLLFVLVFYLSGSSVLRATPVPESESPFSVPAGLQRAVAFWTSIFSEHDSSQLVFFDPEKFSIYKVVDIDDSGSTRRQIRLARRRIMSQHGLSSSRQIRVQRGLKDRFAAGLERSGRYLPAMREIFAEEGVPQELVYLPLVESSFRIDARSRLGAVGMWQFMRGTGRRYMTVSRHLDERRDPLESTRAAARLLVENYRVLGNWPLAVTAYNHGQAGIARAVRQVGSDDLTDIIRRYRGSSFKFASKNFYAEFLAALHVAQNAKEYFPGIAYDAPLAVEEIELGKYVRVREVVQHAELSHADLLRWNPALTSKTRWLPKGYRLKVPPESAPDMRAAVAQVKEMTWIPYVVSRGDSLSRIASRHGTSVYDIQIVNGIGNVHRIRVGQELKLPRTKTTARKPQKIPQRGGGARPARYHRVARGETLSVIAERYGVSLRKLKTVNGLSNIHRIRTGQRLRIPHRS